MVSEALSDLQCVLSVNRPSISNSYAFSEADVEKNKKAPVEREREHFDICSTTIISSAELVSMPPKSSHLE